MRFATMAISNLARRPLRTALTAIGIAVAVGAFVAMVGLSRGVERAMETGLVARGTHLLAMQKGAVQLLTTSVDAALGEKIAAVDGVQAVAGELGDMMTVEDEHTTVALGWARGCYLWRTLRLVAGRLPGDDEDGVVVIGQAAAETLGKKPGDRVWVRDRDFTIVGVFTLTGVLGNNSVVMPLAAMQEMMQRAGKVTAFHLRVDRPDDAARVAAVRARLAAAFPGLSFVETSTVTEDDQVLKLFRAIAWSISALAIAIALVVVLNTLLMAVLERTREIGVLSAVGWPPARILALFVVEGVALTLGGGVAGLALGVGGLRVLTGLPRLHGLIEADLGLVMLRDVLVATVVLGVLGSLYPAWRATRLDTVDALRHE